MSLWITFFWYCVNGILSLISRGIMMAVDFWNEKTADFPQPDYLMHALEKTCSFISAFRDFIDVDLLFKAVGAYLYIFILVIFIWALVKIANIGRGSGA